MKRIYTRTGDKGSTAIHGGERVAKTDIRIEANGCVDELNVAIGMLRTLLGNEHQWQEMLREIQLNLMTMMSLIATRQEKRIDNPNTLPEDIVAQTESIIDCLNEECTPPDSFILPGGTLAVAQIHQCRVEFERAGRSARTTIMLFQSSFRPVFHHGTMGAAALRLSGGDLERIWI
jgi:ATP:cob(I)alamin adenosyltransferase